MLFGSSRTQKKTTEYLLGETCEMSRISIEIDFGRLHE